MTLDKTIVAILILACLGFAAVTWEEFRTDRASLEKAIATQQQVIDAAETREQSRDASLKITMSQMAAANRSVQSPQEIVNALQQLLGLPKPITLGNSPTVNQQKTRKGSRTSTVGGGTNATYSSQSPAVPITRSVPPELKSEVLDFFRQKSNPRATITAPQLDYSTHAAEDIHPRPNPDGMVEMATADLKPLFDESQSCRTCESQLAVCQADLADEKTRSASLTKERDAIATYAKGGSFWHRLKQNAKWLALGAAISAGAIRIR